MLHASTSSAHERAAQASSLTTIDLDTIDAAQLARVLSRQIHQPRPQLLIDCGSLRMQRTRGVSHVVSQLLALRQSGAGIWLRNVNPALNTCLRLLQLDQVFKQVD
ncbi:hypothetical protein LJY25_08640 [Hymenobacter sp. BT175]|uniref:hypothetical protein n=1 Tax=Hymenobacter translucens TaxID=2886507 RepID=UPI001D0E3DB1|nr:hypothetical protein [Hymenobacter translucens]MCC2546508.1 hypothetical protein [Hymenobacter translucens]